MTPIQGGPRTTAPVPFLRKILSLPAKPKSAQLHVTALGVYECEINGKRVGDHVFAPGWTNYYVRVPVQTYDVRDLLQSGENVLGAVLGDGWYCGYVAAMDRQLYGDRPRFLAQLEIECEDGARVTVGTDASWKWSTGPILESDMIMGEAYDARRELKGWSSPGYDETSWQSVLVAEWPKIELTRSAAPPVRAIEELAPLSCRTGGPDWSKKKHRIYDFGQNLTGRVRIKVRAKAGDNLKIRFAEVLNPDGSLYTENLRSARATDYYTCAGNGEETWEPRFTFHGFRYAEVDGLTNEDLCEVTAVVLHSDMALTGKFQCSSALLNQQESNILWGQKGNFLEVPTDCPQRDERLGWTGDAQVFIRTAAFHMDVKGFFHKWLQDIRDAQGEDGAIPCFVPDTQAFGLRGDGGPAWADATFICPWTIYVCYGDPSILAEHYDCMRRYMDYLAGHKVKDGIRAHPAVDGWGGFGDWLALDGSGRWDGGTPKDLIGTAFYAAAAGIMAKSAQILGKTEDAARYTALREEVTQAFNRRFVTGDGLLAGGTQTCYVLALHFDLLPEALRPGAARELVRDIERRGFHLATGFVGTPYLLFVLERFGHLDVAYKLLEQETFPSWLFPVKNGATTIWERWDGWTTDKGFQDKAMNSFNHYAYGAVGEWMYRTVAGLEADPEEPGYKHIIFRPRPGGTLTWAEASLKTAQGEASIRWDLDGDTLKLRIQVPDSAHGTLDLPAYGKSMEPVGPGSHEFVLRK